MKIWIYWWWVLKQPGTNKSFSPFIRTACSTTHWCGKHMTEYDRKNGWKVGKVHKMRVDIEKPC